MTDQAVKTIVNEGGSGGIVKYACTCGEEFGAPFGGEWAPSVTEDDAARSALDELRRHAAETGCVVAAPELPEREAPALTTVPPDFGGFDDDGRGWYYHLRDGFYFRGRGTDVTIAVKQADGTFLTITVPPNEWASTIAAVSARGETSPVWEAALELHALYAEHE